MVCMKQPFNVLYPTGGILSLLIPLPSQYSTFSHFAPSIEMTSIEFLKIMTNPETRVFQGADSEDSVILACVVFARYSSVTSTRIERLLCHSLNWESAQCYDDVL